MVFTAVLLTCINILKNACFTVNKLPRACLRFGCWSSLCPVSLLTSKPSKPKNADIAVVASAR